MKILIASSEVVPFAKTGGLADVVGALPKQLVQLGHEVIVFVPGYSCIHQAGIEFEPTPIQFQIPIGLNLVPGGLSRGRLPDSDVTVYAVENVDFFHRDQLYGEGGEDYADNCQRFVFFCRSIVEAIRVLQWTPDILHANDWQTCLLPALLKTEMAQADSSEQIASLLTVHNLAYQGNFWHWDMLLTGIDWKHFNWREMEFFGRLNLLKTGIVFADAINTVSPTYAAEIQTTEHGCGLDGALRQRGDVLSGILNGIDDREWNPASDPHLPVNYDYRSWREGKAACKSALQRERNLPENPETPLIGIIGRLASQKGWSLIIDVMRHWLENFDAQWVVLGTGQAEYHQALSELAERFPAKLALELGFSNGLAHQIEAASDVFVMPSQYEPCGLNQLYSLAYGTVPVVRQTGGLADTVVDLQDHTRETKTANGFSFESFDAAALDHALGRAVQTYREAPDVWEQLVVTGMQQDWSWANSARKYERLYEQTIARVQQPQGAR